MIGSKSDSSDIERFNPILTPDDRGVWASSGDLYYGAVFGRDSIEVGEDTLDFHPELSRKILLTMASYQGLAYDRLSESEVGRIHHEQRNRKDAKNNESRAIFDRLTKIWGGTEDSFIYYGSVDATPLFLRLLGRYVGLNGNMILENEVTGRDGKKRLFGEHVELAAKWLQAKIESSENGFVEYKRFHNRGIENQVWKDSLTSYIHENGELAKFENGIASVEVQCYAYDALKAVSHLMPGLVAEDCHKKLGERIIGQFWMSDKKLFAMGLDRDDSGKTRQIKTPSSNAGLVLDSELLLDVEDGEKYVKPTVEAMMSSAFRTRAGIRCRSLDYANLVDYADYHGSYAIWFKETSDIIRGFERHGYTEEAVAIARSLIATIVDLGEYYEFVYVDEEDNIRWLGKDKLPYLDPARCNTPEPDQAWTISAFIRSMRLLKKYESQ